jgi:hypothetical protein
VCSFTSTSSVVASSPRSETIQLPARDTSSSSVQIVVELALRGVHVEGNHEELLEDEPERLWIRGDVGSAKPFNEKVCPSLLKVLRVAAAVSEHSEADLFATILWP